MNVIDVDDVNGMLTLKCQCPVELCQLEDDENATIAPQYPWISIIDHC